MKLEADMDTNGANAAALDEAIKHIRRLKQIVSMQRTGVLCAAAAVAITIIINTRAVKRR